MTRKSLALALAISALPSRAALRVWTQGMRVAGVHDGLISQHS
jgi:hypothetical protein